MCVKGRKEETKIEHRKKGFVMIPLRYYNRLFFEEKRNAQINAFFGKTRYKFSMIKILFICHGNICRSTMAQFGFQHMVNEAYLSDRFEIDSAATSREEIGNGPHRGTVRKLKEVGIPVLPHRARQVTKADYDYYDLLIIMDEENLWGIRRIIREDPENKIHLLLEYAGIHRDVADPWYTGDFDATYRDVTLGCEALFSKLMEQGDV